MKTTIQVWKKWKTFFIPVSNQIFHFYMKIDIQIKTVEIRDKRLNFNLYTKNSVIHTETRCSIRPESCLQIKLKHSTSCLIWFWAYSYTLYSILNSPESKWVKFVQRALIFREFIQLLFHILVWINNFQFGESVDWS